MASFLTFPKWLQNKGTLNALDDIVVYVIYLNINQYYIISHIHVSFPCQCFSSLLSQAADATLLSNWTRPLTPRLTAEDLADLRQTKVPRASMAQLNESCNESQFLKTGDKLGEGGDITGISMVVFSMWI